MERASESDGECRLDHVSSTSGMMSRVPMYVDRLMAVMCRDAMVSD